MIGKRIKSFSGTAPASKAASLPDIIWPPVSDRDSMTAIQAYTRQTPYEYCGNYEYIRGKLSRINTPTGYYENGRHYFYVKDYQGNVRCTVADNDSLTKAVHYYPGGSLFGESYGYYFWSGNNLFQGGKLEKSDAHTFYDLQNRHYDPILNRFTSVDALGEKSQRVSHYIYALGNPVKFIDPYGLEPTDFEAAVMCGMSYHDDDYKYYVGNLKNTGWEEVDASSPLIEGYNFHGTLFMRQKEDGSYEFAYAYPGTNSVKDGVDDITQLIGLSSRYSSTIRIATIISKRFNNFDLTFLGHSLGGGEAAASSIKTGRPAITFNPAALSIATRIKHNLQNDGNITNYITYKQNDNGAISMADAINVGQNIYDMKIPGKIVPIIINYKNGIDAHQIKTIIEYLKP